MQNNEHQILSVSLEEHLVECLGPLPALLPTDLSRQLTECLHSASVKRQEGATPTIPHGLLSSISKWSRTESGRAALSTHAPSLDLRNYDMISLLAGTRTSPDRKFPLYAPESDAREEERVRVINDRKAITTLLNAILSVCGAGFASWYAAGQVRWRDEWRALFGLAVATIVAIAEGVLYVIWDSRRSGKPKRSRLPLANTSAFLKKIDKEPQLPVVEEVENNGDTKRVRKRQPYDTHQEDT